jgi:methylated-DNA-[protein]-cysteine S-methyltransferase
MSVRLIETAWGAFTGRFTERGLAELWFPGNSVAPTSDACSANAGPWLELTSVALNSLLNGREPKQLPPFDFSRGSEFQQRVWQQLLTIRCSETRTYGEIALALSLPGAARAVGAACGANPIPVLVPCHRVLASGGKLGGFSAGLPWKRRLLAAEGLALALTP